MVPEGFEKIPGFPLYRVSREGKIWSEMSNKILKPRFSKRSKKSTPTYFLRKLGREYQSSVSVSKIVLTVFKEKQPPNTRVDYIDGDIQNVHIDNLRWKKVKPQTAYVSEKLGTDTPPITAIDGDEKEVYRNAREAAEDLGVDIVGVLSCLRKTIKTTGGFKFRYSTEEEIRECDMDM